LDNIKAHALVKQTFESIMNARSSVQLLGIVSTDPALYKNRLNREKYPALKLSISTAEIDALKQEGVLTEANEFNEKLSAGKMTALEKLLYATAWKQGDLPKIVHIVEGIHAVGSTVTRGDGDSQVFHQFGRHLADRNEPIIDQHVLRGFKLWKHFDATEQQTTSIRKLNVLNKESRWINEYKNWLKTASLTAELRQDVDHVMNIDSVLFALGKTIKLGKNTA
jgi:hypothetical protein